MIPGIGAVLAKNLISYCGDVNSVFKTSKAKLLKVPGVGPQLAESIHSFDDFQKVYEELVFIEKNKVKTVFFTDKKFPYRLKQCIDSPILLYYKGEIDFNRQKFVSIIGTRMATDYGKEFTINLVKSLAPYSPVIVSGLAYGIDIIAHKEALSQGLDTIAVLGHGLETVYPSQHRRYADNIVEQGALLTEFHSHSQINKNNFPKRNRIVAGLSDAIVVAESNRKGGAMITAEIGNSYNRDVFALPGNLDRKTSEGCNHLIKAHKASLIESAKDITYMLRWEEITEEKVTKPELLIDLSDEEQVIYDYLKQSNESYIDDISLNCNLNASKIASALLSLEFSGAVKSLPGKKYKAIQ